MKVWQEPMDVKSFPFYLRRSTYIHILLILLTIGGGKIVLDIKQKERDKNLELIQASVRVDMVAMPTYTINELKNISSGVEEAKPEEKTPETTKEAIKEETKIEEKVVDKADSGSTFEEAQAKKRQDFLNKLKSLGNKKVEADGKQKADKGLYGDKESTLKNLVLSGNKLSTGTQMYGDGPSGDMTAFQAYAVRLPDLIRPHWKLPSFLIDKKLKCRIRVWLDMSGEISRISVYQSSGDPEYDQRAVEAIRAAAPFPALKEEFGKRAQNGDILLGFPL